MTNSGEITETETHLREWQIEHSELHQIYPPLPENVDKDGAQPSAEPDAPTLEAEIAALVEEIGQGLRQSDDDHWDTAQGLQLLGAGPSHTEQCAATIPWNSNFKVREPHLEQRAWAADIRINDPERPSAASSPDIQETRAALAIATVLGISAIGWIADLPSGAVAICVGIWLARSPV
jgi:hypothetical protein